MAAPYLLMAALTRYSLSRSGCNTMVLQPPWCCSNHHCVQLPTNALTRSDELPQQLAEEMLRLLLQRAISPLCWMRRWGFVQHPRAYRWIRARGFVQHP
eukprot:355486-Chlamydomonas_euryale.AAC.1